MLGWNTGMSSNIWVVMQWTSRGDVLLRLAFAGGVPWELTPGGQ